jgi:hypothetical protein
LGYATNKDPWPAATPGISITTTPGVFADNNLPYADAMQKYCP